MLISLQIENYAIIRSLKIGFNAGFTAITGETGAGKSILLGALSLLFGNRADTSVLFDNNKKCVVEGEFSIEHLNLKNFFEINDLDYQIQTIIRREISPSGKSRAFINDTPVNLNTLKELTAHLVDIHSQHSHLLLGDSNFKMKIVDEYAQNGKLLQLYKNNLKQYNHLVNEIEKLKTEATQAEREEEFLNFQLNELHQANLQIDEEKNLEKEIEFLTHAEEIKGNLFQASQLIGEKEDNALQIIHQCKQCCRNIEQFNNNFAELAQRLETLEIELKDIDYELNRHNEDIEFNPNELENKKERLSIIYALEKKHNTNSVQELFERVTELEGKRNKISDYQINIDNLEKEKIQLQKELEKEGAELSLKRKQCIPEIEKALQAKIGNLGMEHNRFQIQLTTGNEFRKDGIDHIELLFSANIGVALAPIEKAASGGELSRIMLSIKSLMTEKSLFPTIIFDEIDTGISGTMAGKVATAMDELSKNHQLIVITHLPQIAAKAQYQYKVYKEITDNKTYTNLKSLTNEEREHEIALMIGGEKLGNNTLLAAKELLAQKL